MTEESSLQIRKTGDFVFRGFLLYTLISSLLAGIFKQTGLSQDLSVILGDIITVVYAVYFRSGSQFFDSKDLFHYRKPVDFRTFFFFLCLMGLVQSAGSAFAELIGHIGGGGASLEGLIELDTAVKVLSVGIVAPIVEELLFRGMAVRSLEKYGKCFTMVVTAVAFGLMHMNIGQFLAGFGTGLLFAYLSMEYSIRWTILLHFFNNFILISLPVYLAGPGSYRAVCMVSDRICLVLGVLGIIGLIRRCDAICSYVSTPEFRSEPNTVGALFRSSWAVIFTVLTSAVTILYLFTPDLFTV